MQDRERRAKRRFPTHLPIFTTRTPPPGEIQGVTRDVSSGGVFFYVSDWPLKETSIEFKIGLPLGTIPAKNVSAICKGRVVRVEMKGRRTGIAATIDDTTFLNPTSP